MLSKTAPIGRARFPAAPLEERLLSQNDLTVAEQHAARERADAVRERPDVVMIDLHPAVLLSRVQAVFGHLKAVAA